MPPTNTTKAKTAPVPKTLAEQIAALPALTSYAPYREVRERDQALARDRQKLMEERAVVLVEMEKYPGLAALKLEDIEPLRLAGLDTEEMRVRANLAERLAGFNQKAALLDRARELLAPELERLKREALEATNPPAFAIYKEAILEAAAKYFDCVRAFRGIQAMRHQLGANELLGGMCSTLPLPIDGVFRANIGLSAGPGGVIDALSKYRFIDEAEAAELRAAFRN